MNPLNFPALERCIILRLVVGIAVIALTACNTDSEPVPDLPLPDEQSLNTLDQGVAAAPIIADLSNDALIPPVEPVLEIAARPGKLTLTWSEHSDTTNIAIYRYDASKGFEQKLDLDLDPASTTATLPSQTHRTAWHRTQYRIELCSNIDCVSSQRVGIVGLAEQTVTRLMPGVFIKDERYAQNIASNNDASVFALSRPLEGAIDIHIHTGEQWVLTQHLRLSDLTLSSTRRLHMTLSGSGDVLAVLIADSSAQASAQIRILERLGEAWLETQQLSTTLAINPELPAGTTQGALQFNSSLNNKATLQLSDNGERLLLKMGNAVSLYTRTSTGWTQLESDTEMALPPQATTHPHSVDLSNYFQDRTPLLSISASSSLHRIFTLHENGQQLWLVQWREKVVSGLPSVWHPDTPMSVTGLDVSSDIHMRSNDQGSRIVIAGWENTTTTLRTPVLWRFQIIPDNPASNDSSVSSEPVLSILDSLRLAPTAHTGARLQFASDNMLSNLALGWQLEQRHENGSAEDAHLVTYSYHMPTRQWLTALELPEAVPTLAKRSFASTVVMSADGKTLFLGTGGHAEGSSVNGAEVLVLN